MLVKVTKRAKIWHKPGDIVDVSDTDAVFLMAVGAAEVYVSAAPSAAEKQLTDEKPARKSAKK